MHQAVVVAGGNNEWQSRKFHIGKLHSTTANLQSAARCLKKVNRTLKYFSTFNIYSTETSKRADFKFPEITLIS